MTPRRGADGEEGDNNDGAAFSQSMRRRTGPSAEAFAEEVTTIAYTPELARGSSLFYPGLVDAAPRLPPPEPPGLSSSMRERDRGSFSPSNSNINLNMPPSPGMSPRLVARNDGRGTGHMSPGLGLTTQSRMQSTNALGNGKHPSSALLLPPDELLRSSSTTRNVIASNGVTTITSPTSPTKTLRRDASSAAGAGGVEAGGSPRVGVRSSAAVAREWDDSDTDYVAHFTTDHEKIRRDAALLAQTAAQAEAERAEEEASERRRRKKAAAAANGEDGSGPSSPKQSTKTVEGGARRGSKSKSRRKSKDKSSWDSLGDDDEARDTFDDYDNSDDDGMSLDLDPEEADGFRRNDGDDDGMDDGWNDDEDDYNEDDDGAGSVDSEEFWARAAVDAGIDPEEEESSKPFDDPRLRLNWPGIMLDPDSMTEAVSLMNFPQHATTVTLTSPRSVQACARLGILPTQLLARPVTWFETELTRQRHGNAFISQKNVPRYAKMHFKHAEEKRQADLKACRAERAVVIKEHQTRRHAQLQQLQQQREQEEERRRQAEQAQELAESNAHAATRSSAQTSEINKSKTVTIKESASSSNIARSANEEEFGDTKSVISLTDDGHEPNDAELEALLSGAGAGGISGSGKTSVWALREVERVNRLVRHQRDLIRAAVASESERARRIAAEKQRLLQLIETEEMQCLVLTSRLSIEFNVASGRKFAFATQLHPEDSDARYTAVLQEAARTRRALELQVEGLARQARANEAQQQLRDREAKRQEEVLERAAALAEKEKARQEVLTQLRQQRAEAAAAQRAKREQRQEKARTLSERELRLQGQAQRVRQRKAEERSWALQQERELDKEEAKLKGMLKERRLIAAREEEVRQREAAAAAGLERAAEHEERARALDARKREELKQRGLEIAEKVEKSKEIRTRQQEQSASRIAIVEARLAHAEALQAQAREEEKARLSDRKVIEALAAADRQEHLERRRRKDEYAAQQVVAKQAKEDARLAAMKAESKQWAKDRELLRHAGQIQLEAAQTRLEKLRAMEAHKIARVDPKDAAQIDKLLNLDQPLSAMHRDAVAAALARSSGGAVPSSLPPARGAKPGVTAGSGAAGSSTKTSNNSYGNTRGRPVGEPY